MTIIKNIDELRSESKIRKDALEIIEVGYETIKTETVLGKKISMQGDDIFIDNNTYAFSDYENIYFIGIGKCAFEGAKVIEGIMGEKITDGVVLDVYAGILKKIKSFKGTHPLPSNENISVTKQMVELLGNVTEKDLVIVLISGGGSALLCLPHSIDCDALIQITSELMKSGADINEINTVRKHLSEIQGGQLAELVYPANIVSLIFSDVPGDDISVIASGPTVRDESTSDDARAVLDKYNILEKCGIDNIKIKETPKDKKYFEKTKNILVVSNNDALNAMSDKAKNLGYETEIRTSELSGYARDVGRVFAEEKKRSKYCLLAGGETTVKIEGKGKGGRNQECVLAAIPYLPEGRIFASVASDGIDNTDAAGAIGDTDIFRKSNDMNINIDDYLQENNSYEFFRNVGGQIKTGSTGSNVSDLLILLDD